MIAAIALADPSEVATAEFAPHISWMARDMIGRENERQSFAGGRGRFADRPEAVAALLTGVASEIHKAGSARMEHFGD